MTKEEMWASKRENTCKNFTAITITACFVSIYTVRLTLILCLLWIAEIKYVCICMYTVMPNSHCPPDTTRQRCLCRVRRCELSRPDKCVLRRSASSGRTAPPDALRHRPDTERTCLTVDGSSRPTQFTSPHQTRQNSPVCVVCGVVMWSSFNKHSV